MMSKLFLHHLPIVLIALSMAACTTILQQSAPEQDLVSKEEPAPQSLMKRRPPERPKIALSEDILFKVLVAEIAGQRGKTDIAVENYLELARNTRDPVVIERAARIAVYARNDEAAYAAARLWAEVDPYSTDANQILTVMSLRQGDIDKALSHLEVILANTQGKLDQKLWIIANFLGREKDQTAVMHLMERLMENRMNDAEALYVFAHVAARTGDVDRSEKLLEQLLEIKPGNEPAIMAYISLLQKKGDINKAITMLDDILKDKNKNDFNLRMAYARLLTDAKRFDDARRQFKILAVQTPDNVDILYAIGLLYLQVDRLDDAAPYFTRLIQLKKRIYDSNYYLARIAEEKNELDKASDLYLGVHGGENHFDARIRLSLLLVKRGDIEKALTNIRAIEKPKNNNRLILIQAETEILTGQKRYQEAMVVFNKAIEEEKHPDLLYSRAMLAEKMDRLDILETDLRAILAEDKDDATVLNALGYTLADRTDRHDEAYTYIKRAYELSPNDFYILDSMGWVLYRLGRLDEAVEYLKKALALRNDPEIAAHLGEVLWVIGDKQAAKAVWETALKNTPADDRLLKVIERFKP